MKRYRTRKGEFGGVFVEAGLAIPFLAFMLLLLADGIHATRNYIALTLIARETVISASTLAGLDDTMTIAASPPSMAQLRQCYDANMTNYSPPPGMNTECARRLLSQRVSGLSRAYALAIPEQSLSVRLEKTPGNRLLTARVSSTLPRLSSFIRNFTISTTATGSYDA